MITLIYRADGLKSGLNMKAPLNGCLGSVSTFEGSILVLGT